MIKAYLASRHRYGDQRTGLLVGGATRAFILSCSLVGGILGCGIARKVVAR